MANDSGSKIIKNIHPPPPPPNTIAKVLKIDVHLERNLAKVCYVVVQAVKSGDIELLYEHERNNEGHGKC